MLNLLKYVYIYFSSLVLLCSQTVCLGNDNKMHLILSPIIIAFYSFSLYLHISMKLQILQRRKEILNKYIIISLRAYCYVNI